ncbi:MAG TPA: polysaccharide deacetylase family protein [Nitrososphaera sp.]|jgi:hypothetical protein
MASLVTGGVIAVVAVIAIGVLYALPPYLKGIESWLMVPDVLLSLDINSDQNTLQWCQGIAELLNENQLKAVVFIPGKVAEQYPDCVRAFNDNVDIGSSTYSFAKLSSERDYLEMLEDVRRGKAAVDSVAGIDSRLFSAPYGYTDENIYSLLSRNGIVADFSGSDSYNKYNGTHFISYELKTLDLSKSSVDEIESQIAKKVSDQIRITADNSVSVGKVTSLIARILEKQEANFVNASDVTGMKLTVRGE